MRNPVIFLLAILSLFASSLSLSAQADVTGAVVFSEPSFPSINSASISSAQLTAILPGAQLASADQLSAALAAASSHLLVLPYGSAFPEDAWPAIKAFLDRGGNLLVLGGMPFSRAVYRDHGEWRIRDYSVRFIRRLMIDQYQETPGSDGSQFQANPDLPLQLRPFAWK